MCSASPPGSSSPACSWCRSASAARCRSACEAITTDIQAPSRRPGVRLARGEDVVTPWCRGLARAKVLSVHRIVSRMNFRPSRVLLAALASAALALAAQPAAAVPNTTAAVAAPGSDDPAYPFTRPNPEAEIGKLPNGLTYGVMRRAGTRQVSIILMVGAGSGDEQPNERGVAHFLEHMAFNGSTHFPPGTVMKRFADIGVSIGRDQNAETGFDSTTFSLDLSEITPDRLDMSFP